MLATQGVWFASIVIPVRNEVGNLPVLIAEIDAVLATIPEPIEVLFVDDCSEDGSAEVLDDIAASHPDNVRVFHLARRGGQTGAYQLAFNEARGTFIIRIDSDLQDNPADLVDFMRHLRAGCDLVMGLRTLRKHRRILRAASILYDSMVVMLLDSPLYTNTSSFVAFRREHVTGIAFKPNDHRYLPIIAMRRGATKLKEVIVANRERGSGKSNYRNYKKVITGAPEVTAFMARLLAGYYDLGRRHQLPVVEWRGPAVSRRRP